VHESKKDVKSDTNKPNLKESGNKERREKCGKFSSKGEGSKAGGQKRQTQIGKRNKGENRGILVEALRVGGLSRVLA